VYDSLVKTQPEYMEEKSNVGGLRRVVKKQPQELLISEKRFQDSLDNLEMR
jgi:hypothetical protein